jgi:hypothetical protein
MEIVDVSVPVPALYTFCSFEQPARVILIRQDFSIRISKLLHPAERVEDGDCQRTKKPGSQSWSDCRALRDSPLFINSRKFSEKMRIAPA